MDKKNITYCSIKELKPYIKNNKKHPERQIKLIAESIKRFGFNTPIIIDGDYNIIAGHGRLMAAKKLKMQEVPTILLDNLSEKEVIAYRLLDNRLGDLAEYDVDNITVDLADLGDFELGDESIEDLFSDILNIDLEDEEGAKLSDKYTKKIEAPIYEPSGNKYQLHEIYSKEKYDNFITEIQNTDGLSDEIREFLIFSASRHIEFNFQKIADYYTNLDNVVIKNLFEKLALVIIDYNSAIENGYVQLSKALLDLADKENEK